MSWEGSEAPYKKKKKRCRLRRSGGVLVHIRVHMCTVRSPTSHPHHDIDGYSLRRSRLTGLYKTCLLLFFAFNDQKIYTLQKYERRKQQWGHAAQPLVPLLLCCCHSSPHHCITCVQRIRARSLTKTKSFFFLRRCVVRRLAGFFLFFSAAGRGVSANFQRLLWLVYD